MLKIVKILTYFFPARIVYVMIIKRADTFVIETSAVRQKRQTLIFICAGSVNRSKCYLETDDT